MSTSTPQPRTVKVAIVGTGLAGLTAAYVLTEANQKSGRKGRERKNNVIFEVHLFEKADGIGLDVWSISLKPPPEDSHLKEMRIDVPMRSFQGGYYRNLIGLCKHLQIPIHPIDFSYSFANLISTTASTTTNTSGTPPQPSRTIRTSFIYNGASGRNGLGIPSSFLPPTKPKPRGSHHRRTATSAFTRLTSNLLYVIASIPSILIYVFLTLNLLNSYLRLVFLSLPVVRARDSQRARQRRRQREGERVDGVETLRQWTERKVPKSWFARWLGSDRSWRDFIESVIVPLFSGICTGTREDMWDHPVEEILEYVWQSQMTRHYVTPNGVRDLVAKLTQLMEDRNIHLSATITSITSDPFDPSKVSLHFTQQGSSDSPEDRTTSSISGFDHLILATQANAAQRLVDTYLASLTPSSTSNGSSSFAPSSPIPTPFQRQRSHLRELSVCLSTFITRKNIVVNHTDHRLLPKDRRDWRDHNLVCPVAGDETALESDPSSLTIMTDLDEDSPNAQEVPDISVTAHTPISSHENTLRARRHQARRLTVTKLCVSPTHTMTTHIIPTPHTLTYVHDILLPIQTFPLAQVFQTTNPIIPPRKEKVLSVATMERAVLTVEAKEAQMGLFIRDGGKSGWFGGWWDGKIKLGYLQGGSRGLRTCEDVSVVKPGGNDDNDNERDEEVRREVVVPGIWLCGSYSYPGIPLLEGCVRSAREVVEDGLMAGEGVYKTSGWAED